MAVEFSMRDLLEAGVHFGHHKRRWNPEMKKYIFGTRDNIHILNLEQTVPMLREALTVVEKIASKGGRVLFVGTKRQASEIVAEAAERCGQYYVNERWLGGMLTNWKTVSQSIKTLKNLEAKLEDDGAKSILTKKEILDLERKQGKLNSAIGGIKDMGGIPDLIFVIDTNKESIAIQEANRLNIPVVAIVDSNATPAGVQYPVPGNDDAIKAISLYCDLIVKAVLEGIRTELKSSGKDFGESVNAPVENLPKKAPAKKPATEKADAKPAAKKAPAKKPAAKKEEK